MDPVTGLFGANQPNYGGLAARSEKKRQAIINLGLDQINAVYGGGSAPFYTMANADGAKFSGKNTYYTLNSKGFVPYWAPNGTKSTTAFGTMLAGPNPFTPGAPFIGKALGIDKLFGKSESPRDIAKKAFRRGQLFNAPTMQNFEGFQPEFYQQREKAYTDFALPQLADQYQTANQQLTYGMSNQGLRGSSVDDKARFQLEKTMTQGKQGVADEAINQSNQLKNRVEESRQSAINQLYQTSNPSQAVQSAIANASQFQQPSSFAPLANTFANLANQYYTQQLLAGYKNAGSQQQPVENNLYYAPI